MDLMETQVRYTKEFREEAVKRVMEEHISLTEAGRRLSLAPSTISIVMQYTQDFADRLCREYLK